MTSEFCLLTYYVNPDISTAIRDNIALALPLRFGEISCEAQVTNHNPVRVLHGLALLLSTDASEEEILMLVETLFSFADEKEGKYGYAFIVLLKLVWRLFSEMENYKNEPYENLLIWAYLWSDKALSCLTKLERENYLDVATYVKKVEESADIDIKTDGLWDTTENEDVLSPVQMNLFKLCVTGTMLICNRCENRMGQLGSVILDRLIACYSVWINVPIYYREAELMHHNEKNCFGAIFTGNVYFLIESLEELGNCEGKICIREPYGAISSRIKSLLQRILEGAGVGVPELVYLFVISREDMEEAYVDMVKEIIEKQVLGQAFQIDLVRYRLLAYIVRELPKDFQDEYIIHEFARVGALLHTREMQWEEVYNLVLEIIQFSDYENFYVFWEKYVDELEGFEALQMAEWVGRIQLAMPLEYAERTRNLRMRLELKS